jgi:hypothetical protein
LNLCNLRNLRIVSSSGPGFEFQKAWRQAMIEGLAQRFAIHCVASADGDDLRARRASVPSAFERDVHTLANDLQYGAV